MFNTWRCSVKKALLASWLLTLGIPFCVQVPRVEAQLLLVSGEYRVTEVDEDNQRFGVALPEARPDVTQNWVYVEPKTTIQKRVTNSDGWHKDESLNYYQFFQAVKPGQMLKVHGGRRWDGGITSKSLQVGYPGP